MGGGDLNMKKSWHPLLMKNQERVWKEERKALEERKKTAQLQKELAEERQLQELQRLQAEQGGGRREERVEWLYATPAIGNGINTEEQEAYLLGKKTVDKLFKEKDEAAAKLQARAASQSHADQAGGGFISLQNANTARDTASKIREDPLLAIKQQEQLAYENLKKNPARLKALQANLISKDERKKEKEEKRKLKKEIKEARKRSHDNSNGHSHGHYDPKRARDERYPPRKLDRSASPEGHYRTSRRTSPSFRHDYDDPNNRNQIPAPSDYQHRGSRHRRPSRSRSRSISPSWKSKDYSSKSHHQGSSNANHSSHYRHRDSSHRSDHEAHRHHESDRESQRNTYKFTHQQKSRVMEKAHRSPKSAQRLADSKAAKLAEMQAAAESLQESRSRRLKELESEDAAKLKLEEAERGSNRVNHGGVGDGTKAKFVIEQEKRVFFGQMGLAERVKRSGGVGLLKDRE